MFPEQDEEQTSEFPSSKVVLSSGPQADQDDKPSPLEGLGNWIKQSAPMKFLNKHPVIAGAAVGALALTVAAPLGGLAVGGAVAHAIFKKNDWQKKREPSAQPDTPQITQKGPSFSPNPS